MIIDIPDDQWAMLFHNTYESMAPEFGYETREDTKQFDSESPNGKLMTAVVGKFKEVIEDNMIDRVIDHLERNGQTLSGFNIADIELELNNMRHEKIDA